MQYAVCGMHTVSVRGLQLPGTTSNAVQYLVAGYPLRMHRLWYS